MILISDTRPANFYEKRPENCVSFLSSFSLFSSTKGTATMKAIVIGGTGAVGQHLVQQLLEHPEVSRVTLISRRKYQTPDAKEIPNPEKLEEKMVSMDKMEEAAEAFGDHDAAFCTLGESLLG